MKIKTIDDELKNLNKKIKDAESKSYYNFYDKKSTVFYVKSNGKETPLKCIQYNDDKEIHVFYGGHNRKKRIVFFEKNIPTKSYIFSKYKHLERIEYYDKIGQTCDTVYFNKKNSTKLLKIKKNDSSKIDSETELSIQKISNEMKVLYEKLSSIEKRHDLIIDTTSIF